MGFQRASKAKAKLRLALIAPANGGKTMTALKAATYFAKGGDIAVIDTEEGSASLYADQFAFDVMNLDEHHRTPEDYVRAIHEAHGYDVLVIDSATHEWQACLEEVDRLKSRGGNQFTVWKDVTPKHQRFLNAILSFPGHVIVTMRAKTAYVMDEDSRGKQKPRKVGLAPVMREGVDYEFTVVGEMSPDRQILEVTKTRCSAIAGKTYEQPGTKDGNRLFEELDAWLRAGVDRPADATVADLVACKDLDAIADLKARAKSEWSQYADGERERVAAAVKTAEARAAKAVDGSEDAEPAPAGNDGMDPDPTADGEAF